MIETEKLFNQINKLSTRVSQLSHIVQNDFDRMLEDGYITKEELVGSIPEVELDFNNVIFELQELEQIKNKTINILKSYGTK